MGDDFRIGERVIFTPKKGKPREGVVEGISPYSKTVIVQLDTDPFPVEIKESRISTCKDSRSDIRSKKVLRSGTKRKKEKMTATPTKPTGKQLRKQAQSLGIEGWQDMSRKELVKAIKDAEKSEQKSSTSKRGPKTKAASKPAKATKKATKKSATKSKGAGSSEDSDLGISLPKGSTVKPLPEEGENPFRKSSNLYLVAKLLMKGGKRRDLAEKLAEQVELHPYHKNKADIDLGDYDKRIVLGAQTMRDRFGYGIQRVGRGMDGRILVFRPGGPKDPRNKTAKKAAKRK